MTHPNTQTADALDALQEKAKEADPEGYTVDAVQILAWEYRDWLTGAWSTTPENANDLLCERVLYTVHTAEDSGLWDIAQGLRELFGGEPFARN